MPLTAWGPIVGLPLQATTDETDPFESVSNFFDSSTWSLITFALQVFVFLLWAALIWWTYQDARRRITSPPLVAASVALSVLLPFLGTIIYLVVRPPEYLLEARERELELIALEQRLGALGDEEGQRIVGRLLAREQGGVDASTQSALRQAGVATRDDLRDLDIRLTELEYRLRRAAAPRSEPERPAERARPAERPAERPRSERSAERPRATERPRTADAAPTRRPPADEPVARRPATEPPVSADDTGRTMIRRVRRTVRPDPEASVE